MPKPSSEEEALPNELNSILNSLGLPLDDATSFDMEKWCEDNELSQYLGSYTTTDILRIHSAFSIRSNKISRLENSTKDSTPAPPTPSTKKEFEKANIPTINDQEKSFPQKTEVPVEQTPSPPRSFPPELREDSIFYLLQKIDSECESIAKRKIHSVKAEDFESAQLLKLGYQSLMELRKEVESKKTVMDEFLKDEKYMKCKELKEDITNLEGEVADILRQLETARNASASIRNNDVKPVPAEHETPVTWANENISWTRQLSEATIPAPLSEQYPSFHCSSTQKGEVSNFPEKRSNQAFSLPVSPAPCINTSKLTKTIPTKRSGSTVPGFLGASIPRTPHSKIKDEYRVDAQSFASSPDNRSTKRNLFPKTVSPTMSFSSPSCVVEPIRESLWAKNYADLDAKDWKDRHQALIYFCKTVEKKKASLRNFQKYVSIMEKTIDDNVLKVSLQTLELYQIVTKYFLAVGKPSVFWDNVENLSKLILDKGVSSTKARLRERSLHVICHLIEQKKSLNHWFENHIIQNIPDPKDFAGKYLGRLQVLHKLIERFGVSNRKYRLQTDEPQPLQLNGVMNLLLPSLNHPSQEIRTIAINIIIQISTIVGSSVMDLYLDKVRPSILDSLQARYDEVFPIEPEKNMKVDFDENRNTIAHIEEKSYPIKVLEEEDSNISSVTINSTDSSPEVDIKKMSEGISQVSIELPEVHSPPQKSLTNVSFMKVKALGSMLGRLHKTTDSSRSTPFQVTEQMSNLEFLPSSATAVKQITPELRKRRLNAFLGSI